MLGTVTVLSSVSSARMRHGRRLLLELPMRLRGIAPVIIWIAFCVHRYSFAHSLVTLKLEADPSQWEDRQTFYYTGWLAGWVNSSSPDWDRLSRGISVTIIYSVDLAPSNDFLGCSSVRTYVYPPSTPLVVVYRGSCTFLEKVQNVQKAYNGPTGM